MNAGCAKARVLQWFWNPISSQCRVLRGLAKATSMMSCVWGGFMYAGPYKIMFCDKPWMQDAQSIAFHHDFWIQTLRVARICECNGTSVSRFTMHFNANQSPPHVWYGQNLWMSEAFPTKKYQFSQFAFSGRQSWLLRTNFDCWNLSLTFGRLVWRLKVSFDCWKASSTIENQTRLVKGRLDCWNSNVIVEMQTLSILGV